MSTLVAKRCLFSTFATMSIIKMRSQRDCTVLYRGTPEMIRNHRMDYFRRNSQKAEVRVVQKDIVEVYIDANYPSTRMPLWFYEDFPEARTNDKTLITRTTDENFTQLWDILERRVLIEKFGHCI